MTMLRRSNLMLLVSENISEKQNKNHYYTIFITVMAFIILLYYRISLQLF